MPGSVPMRFSVGETGSRRSFTAVEPILAGQLVEWRAIAGLPGTRACGVAAAGSAVVCGVAEYDIPAVAATIQGPAVGIEHALTVLDFGQMPVTYAAAATRGQPLIAAAAGQVTPATGTPTFGQLIGSCEQDSVSAAAVGQAFIKRSGG